MYTIQYSLSEIWEKLLRLCRRASHQACCTAERPAGLGSLTTSRSSLHGSSEGRRSPRSSGSPSQPTSAFPHRVSWRIACRRGNYPSTHHVCAEPANTAGGKGDRSTLGIKLKVPRTQPIRQYGLYASVFEANAVAVENSHKQLMKKAF